MFVIPCPCGCGSILHLPEERRGKVVACPESAQRFRAEIQTQLCNEEIWTLGVDPASMMRYASHHASDRQLLLASVGICRSLGPPMETPAPQRALHLVEDQADGRASREEVGAAVKEAGRWLSSRDGWEPSLAQSMVKLLTEKDVRLMAATACYLALPLTQPTRGEARQAVVEVLHEVFGNPFEPPVIRADWLRWHDQTVQHLAEMIYRERAWHDLPILADALEESGCDSAALLDHLHGPGPHLRGCWALDRILGLK